MEKFSSSKYIKHLYNKYLNKASSGLFLMPAQTGAGKTYATLEWIKEKIGDPSFTGKILYITEIKAQVEEAYNLLTRDLAISEVENVIQLKSKQDTIIEYCLNEKNGLLQKAFSTFGDLSAFAKNITHLKMQKDEFFSRVFNQHELAFQQEVKSQFSKLRDTNNIELLNELYKIYPTLRFQELRVLFMTTRKFLLPVFFGTHSALLQDVLPEKNTFIFIDEIDKQKDVILDSILENDIKDAYDPFSLFSQFHGMLSSKKFFKKYGVKKTTATGVETYINGVHQEYSLEHSFFYPDIGSEMFLKDESDVKLLARGEKGDLQVKADFAGELNYLSNTPKGQETYPFSEVLRKVWRAEQRMIGIIKTLLYSEQLSKKDSLIENSCNASRIQNDFIKDLGLESNDNRYKYLFRATQIHNPSQKDPIKKFFPSMGTSFYEDGFYLLKITNEDNSDKRSIIHRYPMNSTPESFLAEIASKFKVTGISATALMQTVVKNFDLSYLQERLENKFVTPDSNEINEMNRRYEMLQRAKERRVFVDRMENIGLESNIEGSAIELCKALTLETNAVEAIKSYMERIKSHSEGQYKHKIARWSYFMQAYSKFLLADDVRSALYLDTKYIKRDTKDEFDALLINESIFFLLKQYGKKLKKYHFNQLCELEECRIKKPELFEEKMKQSDTFYFVLNSDPQANDIFDEKIRAKLGQGDPVFIAGVYKAIGVGRNLNYKISRAGKKYDKDIDALFLGHITNILALETPDLKSTMRLIYYCMALRHAGEYSSKKAKSILKSILQGRSKAFFNYKETDDYKNALLSTVFQAIGRLYRTDFAENPLRLHYCADITSALVDFDETSNTLLPASKMLLEHARKNAIRASKTEEIIKNQIMNKNERMHHNISSMLTIFSQEAEDEYSKNEREKAIKAWEQIRSYILKHPALASLNNSPFPQCYTPKLSSEKYWFKEEFDYKRVEVCFDNPQSGYKCVAQEAVRLEQIFKIEALRPLAIKGEIASTFSEKHLLLPVVFNNLYKGALGETIGQFLIESYCGIKLHPLSPDRYESYDFVDERGFLFFDFKYYSDFTKGSIERSKLWEKASSKRRLADEKVFIISLFTENSDAVNNQIEEKEGIYFVTHLIRLDEDGSAALNHDLLINLSEKIRQCLH